MNPEDEAELEALRRDVAALGGDPNAVLARVNRPAPAPAPRQGRSVAADVDIGDIQVSAGDVDNEYLDRTTLEGAGQYDQEVLREEARQRKFHEDVTFPYQQYVESGQAKPIQRAPEPRTPPRVYGQYRQQEELDFDQRQHDALRAMEGFGATDAERQRQIRQEIEAYNTGGPGRYRPDPRMSRQLADEMNIDPETGRTVGNVTEDEVRRALQRREELFL